MYRVFGTLNGHHHTIHASLVAIMVLIPTGTGAFALPHLFAEAGLALGTLFLVLVTGLAFLSASFLVEAQAAATLLQLARHCPSASLVAESDADAIAYVDQTSTIISVIMPGWGLVLWFVTIIVYLATDLAVYAVFIPSTLRDVLSDGIRSGSTVILAPEDVYGVVLLILGLVATPMVFFSLKKTTLLQVATTVVRHLVFWTMIGAAIFYFSSSCATLQPVPASAANTSAAFCTGVPSTGCGARNPEQTIVGATSPPPWARGHAEASGESAWALGTSGIPLALPEEAPDPTPHTVPKTLVKEMEFSAIPLLFGGAVYALICQQYIAGMLGPIASRRWATPTIGIVFFVVLGYYLTLCTTAVVAYVGTPLPPPPQSTPTISGECQCTAKAREACPPQSLYTLNFGYLGTTGTLIIVAPLLSLLSSFPVIAITLRDNMIVLYWYLTGRGQFPERDPLVRALACCRCCLMAQREAGEPDVDDISVDGTAAWTDEGNSPSQVRLARLALGPVDRTGLLVTPSRTSAPDAAEDGSPAGPSALSPARKACRARRAGGLRESLLEGKAAEARSPRGSPFVPLLEPEPSTDSLSIQQPVAAALEAGNGAGAEFAPTSSPPQPNRHARPLPDDADETMSLASRYSDVQHHHGPTMGELRDLAELVAGPARGTRAPPSSTQNAPLALRIVFGLLAVAPAFIIASLTDSVDLLVGITGGYGGALIMYVIPGLLLIHTRRLLRAIDAGKAPDHGTSGCPDDPSLDPTFSAASARRWEQLRQAKASIMPDSMSFATSAHWAILPITFGSLCILFNTFNLISGQ